MFIICIEFSICDRPYELQSWAHSLGPAYTPVWGVDCRSSLVPGDRPGGAGELGGTVGPVRHCSPGKPGGPPACSQSPGRCSAPPHTSPPSCSSCGGGGGGRGSGRSSRRTGQPERGQQT